MAYGKEYKKRAIELFEKHGYERTFQELSKEFKQTHPDERTLRRWKDEKSKKIINQERKSQDTTIARSKHYDDLSEIAKVLLGNIDYIWEKPPQGDKWDIFIYMVNWKNSAGMGMTKDMLVNSLDAAFGTAELQFEQTQLHYFVSHFEGEIHGIKSKGIEKVIRENPIYYFNTIKRLADSKLFNSTCELCKGW